MGPQGPVGPQGPAGADAVVNTGTGPGQIPVLDANGKLPSSTLPEGSGGGVKIAMVKDVKPSGVAGGSCFANAWTNRDLNTLQGDAGFVSVSANQFVLSPGKYYVEVEAPSYFGAAHKARLINVATQGIVGVGTTTHSHPNAGSMTTSKITTMLVVTAPTSYQVQHRCGLERLNVGLGSPTNFGLEEIYTTVVIKKIE